EDHVTRSGLPTRGTHLVVGLGSHWTGESRPFLPIVFMRWLLINNAGKQPVDSMHHKGNAFGNRGQSVKAAPDREPSPARSSHDDKRTFKCFSVSLCS